MKKFISILVLCSACNSGNVLEGEFSVESTLSEGTCSTRLVELSNALIEKAEDGYVLTAVNEIRGEEVVAYSENGYSFSGVISTQFAGCEWNVGILLEVYYGENGFVGTLTNSSSAANGSYCWELYDVVGIKVE